MQLLSMLILAMLLLAGVFYAQQNIPLFTRGTGQILATRLLLVVVGVLFGLYSSAGYQDWSARAVAFLIGFGWVHVPAAIILFIKSRRGAGKS